MAGGRAAGTVTVLFTDLVGSTELMASVGDAAFDDVRNTHFAQLRGALAAHDGTEVKSLGDGIMAVFGSASDALACAVAMQRTVDREARRRRAPTVRIGLAVGDATEEDGDWFGTPVVEASRLCERAAAGEILATEVVRVVGGSRAGATFRPMGSLELKGLPEPVPVCAVAWEPEGGAGLPLPPALVLPPGFTFVGRDAEWGQALRLWKEASTDGRRVLLVAGEPGVGKTRLVAELAARAHDEGAVVLAGRCDDGLGVPYQPFVEALTHVVRHAEPAELTERLGRFGGELTRLVPELAQAVPDLPRPVQSDPETEQYRLFEAVASWLTATAEHEPVLLVLDDLHWAARPTLQMLRHVVRSAGDARLHVAATYRDTDLDRAHPLAGLLPELRRESGVDRVLLRGLDEEGVRALVAAAAGHELHEAGEALARLVHAGTEGNPFFVQEVLRYLVETGAVYEKDGRWTSDLAPEQLGIPEGVREVVGRRLSELSDDANGALGVAAVIGAEFDVAVLRVACDLDEDALLAALEEAEARGLVSDAAAHRPAYRFGHALVRGTLYDELPMARRVRLHRRVGDAIEAVHGARLDEHLADLAHHFGAAGDDTGRAVEYAARAGNRALVQLAYDEAVRLYAQALELLDDVAGGADPGTRCDVMIGLGDAQLRAGRPEHRATLLTAAHMGRELGDADRLARAALANSRGFWSRGGLVDADRVTVLEAALDAVDAEDTPTRALLLGVLALELAFEEKRDRRERLAREAVAMARRVGDRAVLGRGLYALRVVLAHPSALAERAEISRELVALADELGDPALTARAWAAASFVAMERADVAEHDRCQARAEAAAEESGQAVLLWFNRIQVTARAIVAGRVEEAERLAVAAFEFGERTGQADARLFFGAQLYTIYRNQDRLEELAPILAAELADTAGWSPLAIVHADVLAQVGRLDEAREECDRLVPAIVADPPDGTFTATLAMCARLCRTLGATAHVAAVYDLLLPYEDRVAGVPPAWTGPCAHFLGLLAATLGRFDDADAHFAAGAATGERMGAPVWLANTRLEWARTLLERGAQGDAERARELLGHAIATSEELGLAAIEQDARALLG